MEVEIASGARIGMYGLGWPFATLTIGPEAIHLSAWPFNYAFKRNGIRALIRSEVLFTSYLKVVHEDYPELILFGPFIRFSKVTDALLEHNYQIADTDLLLSFPKSQGLNRLFWTVVMVASVAILFWLPRYLCLHS